jgi:Kef-type K+ transport system membrane component KefB
MLDSNSDASFTLSLLFPAAVAQLVRRHKNSRTMKTSDRIATLALRVLSAIAGIAVAFGLVFLDGAKEMPSSRLFFAIGGVCFLFGFGCGGDLWGARVFNFFWGIHPDRMADKDAEPDAPGNRCRASRH